MDLDPSAGKRKDRGLTHQLRTLRNWNLGIPDSEDDTDEDDGGLSAPEWMEEEQRKEDNWYREYGLQKTRKIGLGPNDLSYRIPEGATPRPSRPLRQDGTPSKLQDDGFFGEDWREDYIAAVVRRDKDPFYIFLQKLAGATNTTVINLLSPPDVETRALRTNAILQRQTADTKTRFDTIVSKRRELEKTIDNLNAEQADLGANRVNQAEADRAEFLSRRVTSKRSEYDESKETAQRAEDYVTINRTFAEWIGGNDINSDLGSPEMKKALDNRLSSLSQAPETSIYIAPGLRTLKLGGEDQQRDAETVQNQASALVVLKNVGSRTRISDLVFIAIWVLYEKADRIRDKIDGTGDDPVRDLFGILTKKRGLPQKVEDTGTFSFEGDKVTFSEASILNLEEIKKYARAMLNTFYDGVGATTIQTVLNEWKVEEEAKRDGRAREMVDTGAEALRFISNLKDQTRELRDVASFLQLPQKDVRRDLNAIYEELKRIFISRKDVSEDIVARIKDKTLLVEELRFSINRLLQQPVGEAEPSIPYRPEGTWAMDSMFTGWVPLAPIVVYGIEQAYQLIADHVPNLGAANPSDESQIEAAIKTLQTDPRYRAYFVQITARQMGMSRQAFNVRWMPDLSGDHRRVILYNVRKLRGVGGRGISAHFRRALAVM